MRFLTITLAGKLSEELLSISRRCVSADQAASSKGEIERNGAPQKQLRERAGVGVGDEAFTAVACVHRSCEFAQHAQIGNKSTQSKYCMKSNGPIIVRLKSKSGWGTNMWAGPRQQAGGLLLPRSHTSQVFRGVNCLEAARSGGGVPRASYFSSASRDIALAQDNPSDVAALRVGGSPAISPSIHECVGLLASRGVGEARCFAHQSFIFFELIVSFGPTIRLTGMALE